MFGRRKPHGPGEETAPLTPEEEEALATAFERLQAEKRRALAHPGKGWKEWFYHDAAKLWFGMVFLILDCWLVVFWFQPFDGIGLLVSLAIAVYLEFLVYQYFWHRPSDDAGGRSARFRRNWWSPFEYGRWTPEADRARAGQPALGPEGTPDPTEFL